MIGNHHFQVPDVTHAREHDLPAGPDGEIVARPGARFVRPSGGPSPQVAEPSGGPPPEVTEQIAQLRAVRERLVRELGVMEDRVEELARASQARPRQPADDDAARVAALHRKLREASVALAESHRMRAAIADHLVARDYELRSPEIAAEAAVSAAPRRRRLPLVLAGLVAGGAIGAGAAASLGGEETPQPQPPRAAAPAPAPPAFVPPCSELPADAGRASTAFCTTGTTLGKAAGTQPLVFPQTEARVLRVTRSGEDVTVRLRMRNGTQTAQDLGRRIYLGLAGRRIYPATAPGDVAAGAVSTLSLRFAVGATTAPTADLGIVPFGEPADADGARRRGVIQLTLPRG